MMRRRSWVIALILSSSQRQQQRNANALMMISESSIYLSGRIINKHHEQHHHHSIGQIRHLRHHRYHMITTTTTTRTTTGPFKTNCLGASSKNTDIATTNDDNILKANSNNDDQQQQLSIPVGKRTQYTIDDSVCLPTRPHVLDGAVQKACLSIDKYLKYKPIAKHTQQAFDSLMTIMNDESLDSTQKNIILDSGCGTGRSSILLGEMYPNHIIIGVDRSFVRLSKQQGILGDNDSDGDEESFEDDEAQKCGEPSSSSSSSSMYTSFSKRPICQLISNNVILVRAELVDFWRCCLEQNWNITHHYMLYPNPYPTHTRLTQRWYAHPSFPLILRLNANEIIIRANWENYLIEFAKSIEIANDFYSAEGIERGDEKEEKEEKQQPNTTTNKNSKCNNCAEPYLSSALKGPMLRTNKQISMTNFERK